MINIRILGCPATNLRDRIRAAALFFVDEIMPRKRRLYISIKIDNSLLAEHNMVGSCEPVDEVLNKRHYKFAIHLEKTLTDDEMLRTLAHEIVHVKQFTSGQMVSCRFNEDITFWNGKKYDENKTPYDKHPWEIDANKTADKLIKQFYEHGALRQ